MSGICGVWDFSGGIPSISSMLETLHQRGPEGAESFAGDQVALGHTLLATTPEALIEILPIRDQASKCVITADARLDNRDELIRELGFAERERIIGDGELILNCYLRWRGHCTQHLLGDFAFAIWDPKNKSMFCARDHMGVRPFNYHWMNGQRFVFASSSDAVASHPGVVTAVSDERVTDYLADLEAIDLTSTFFESIFRLPPAHSMTVKDGDLKVSRYWKLEPPAELKLDSDAAYEKAFQDVFSQAVQCRLRSAKPVGAMLSGGVDSGSVVAIASRLLDDQRAAPLDTFSAIGPELETCIESRTIVAASKMGAICPHFVKRPDITGDVRGFVFLPDGLEPFDGTMTLIHAVYACASSRDHNVILDGVGGDIALTGGNRIAYLLRRGKFLAAVRESFQARNFWTEAAKPLTQLVSSTWSAFVPSSLRRWRRSLLLKAPAPADELAGLMSNELANRTDLKCRWLRVLNSHPSGQLADPRERAKSITHPNLTVARERYNRVASAYGIEPRDPYLDIRLLKFCLSLPNDQLSRHGWPKSILRRAMTGLLPDSVVWRKGKQHLGRSFIDSVFRADHEWLERLIMHRETLALYIKPEVLASLQSPDPSVLKNRLYYDLFFLLDWLLRVNTRMPIRK